MAATLAFLCVMGSASWVFGDGVEIFARQLIDAEEYPCNIYFDKWINDTGHTIYIRQVQFWDAAPEFGRKSESGAAVWDDSGQYIALHTPGATGAQSDTVTLPGYRVILPGQPVHFLYGCRGGPVGTTWINLIYSITP